MALTYSEAFKIVQKKATELQCQQEEHIAVQDAVGRIAARDCFSIQATPLKNTSAMDGFLVNSSVTRNATAESPVSFTVIGTVVPGQESSNCPPPISVSGNVGLEIMTGGPFPDKIHDLHFLDTCVPIEHVLLSSHRDAASDRLVKAISVDHYVLPGSHERKAGSDIPSDECIIRKGQTIAPSHLLPLLAAKVEVVAVFTRPRIGIWSTGSEFTTAASTNVMDMNGPYLTTMCRELGGETTFLGYLPDNMERMTESFMQAAESGAYDILITTGAVSAGKFDFIRPALLQSGAEILLHGIEMRPGHPVLFASLPACKHASPATIFGLPGNPGAAAACFQFLVTPYIRKIQKQEPESPIYARAIRAPATHYGLDACSAHTSLAAQHNAERFMPGTLKTIKNGYNIVEVSGKTSAAAFRPFISANCWVHLAARRDLLEGDVVPCFPFL